MQNRTYRGMGTRWKQLRADRHLYLAAGASVLLIWVLMTSIELKGPAIPAAVPRYFEPTRPVGDTLPAWQSLSDRRAARYGDVD